MGVLQASHDQFKPAVSVAASHLSSSLAVVPCLLLMMTGMKKETTLLHVKALGTDLAKVSLNSLRIENPNPCRFVFEVLEAPFPSHRGLKSSTPEASPCCCLKE